MSNDVVIVAFRSPRDQVRAARRQDVVLKDEGYDLTKRISSGLHGTSVTDY